MYSVGDGVKACIEYNVFGGWSGSVYRALITGADIADQTKGQNEKERKLCLSLY